MEDITIKKAARLQITMCLQKQGEFVEVNSFNVVEDNRQIYEQVKTYCKRVFEELDFEFKTEMKIEGETKYFVKFVTEIDLEVSYLKDKVLINIPESSDNEVEHPDNELSDELNIDKLYLSDCENIKEKIHEILGSYGEVIEFDNELIFNRVRIVLKNLFSDDLKDNLDINCSEFKMKFVEGGFPFTKLHRGQVEKILNDYFYGEEIFTMKVDYKTDYPTNFGKLTQSGREEFEQKWKINNDLQEVILYIFSHPNEYVEIKSEEVFMQVRKVLNLVFSECRYTTDLNDNKWMIMFCPLHDEGLKKININEKSTVKFNDITPDYVKRELNDYFHLKGRFFKKVANEDILKPNPAIVEVIEKYGIDFDVEKIKKQKTPIKPNWQMEKPKISISDFVDLVNNNVGETYNMNDYDIQVSDVELFRMVISTYIVKHRGNYEFLELNRNDFSMSLKQARQKFKPI